MMKSQSLNNTQTCMPEFPRMVSQTKLFIAEGLQIMQGRNRRPRTGTFELDSWFTYGWIDRNRQKRFDAAKEIARKMNIGITMNEVFAKWTNLRNQYSREKRGQAAMDDYEPKWFAFKAMDTVLSSGDDRKTRNNSEEDPLSTPSPCTPTPSPPPLQTPTPPLASPSSGLLRKIKSENDNSFVHETVEMKMSRTDIKKEQNLDDDLTSFGLYIAAHLRKYPPRLQTKARLEINKMLYTLDMENLVE